MNINIADLSPEQIVALTKAGIIQIDQGGTTPPAPKATTPKATTPKASTPKASKMGMPRTMADLNEMSYRAMQVIAGGDGLGIYKVGMNSATLRDAIAKELGLSGATTKVQEVEKPQGGKRQGRKKPTSKARKSVLQDDLALSWTPIGDKGVDKLVDSLMTCRDHETIAAWFDENGFYIDGEYRDYLVYDIMVLGLSLIEEDQGVDLKVESE